MNKYLVISGMGVALLIGGVILLSGKGSRASENAATIPQQNTVATSPQNGTNSKTVEYTDNGFVPKSISIKAGESVTWVNKASDDFWVASNPHPSHTDYPGFDALKEIPVGGMHSFTFAKVGKWGYHNHLNHTEGGTVVVSQ